MKLMMRISPSHFGQISGRKMTMTHHFPNVPTDAVVVGALLRGKSTHAGSPDSGHGDPSDQARRGDGGHDALQLQLLFRRP
jgi:hypothetical protein